MNANELSSVFVNKMGFLEACSKWKDFPPKPVVYMLVVSEPFKYGGKITDILYIGETKHFGSKPNNNRLWDYYTRATQHEKEIVGKVNELDNTGKSIEIWWCYEWPNNYTHKEYEKYLLQQYSDEHGKLPKFNKR